MGKAERSKGLRGELEVRHAFEDAGLAVHGLDGQGDHLVICANGLTFHVESKRQETLHLDRWSRQAETEAQEGATPLVVYRRSREPWRVSLRLEDLLALIGDLPNP